MDKSRLSILTAPAPTHGPNYLMEQLRQPKLDYEYIKEPYQTVLMTALFAIERETNTRVSHAMYRFHLRTKDMHLFHPSLEPRPRQNGRCWRKTILTQTHHSQKKSLFLFLFFKIPTFPPFTIVILTWRRLVHHLHEHTSDASRSNRHD
jgi:hypothetical protein